MQVCVANYFYFHKDDAEAMSAFKNHIFSSPDLCCPALADNLFLGREADSASKIAHADYADGGALQIYLNLLPDVAVFCMLWGGSDHDQLHHLERLANLTEGSPAKHFGEATVFIGDTISDFLLPDEEEAEEEDDADLGIPISDGGDTLALAGSFGDLFHLPPGDGDRAHYYSLSPLEGLSDGLFLRLVTQKLPELDMSIRRLQQKQVVFEDRRVAIESERRAMDGAVGRFFHREAAAQNEGDKARSDRLASEIGRLSQVYAVLATDAQLMKEAEASFKEEIDALHRCAGAIAGHTLFPDSPLLAYYDGRFGSKLQSLSVESAALAMSLDRVGAAIDIIRTEVGLLRGSEAIEIQNQTRELLRHNVALQQERMALLVAAQVIEFVVVFYYSLSAWDAIVGIEQMEKIPVMIRFGAVALFSGASVGLTHMVAKTILSRNRFSPWLIAAILSVAIALGAIAASTIVYV